MVLQAVIDDSGKGSKPVFILAGFVLSAYQWSVFSDHWQAILDAAPKIKYFKMKEAWSCVEQFKKFSTTQRDAKVQKLIKLIVDYRPLGIRDAMPYEAYERVFKTKLSKRLDYPYFLPYHNIMGTLWQYQYTQNWHPEDKVDFIFDEQGKESQMAQLAWDFTVSSIPGVLKKFIGDRPIHRDEKTFLPLQAADMFAWLSHRSRTETLKGQEFDHVFWKSISSLEYIEDEWTEERLKRLHDRIRATGNVFEYDLKSRKQVKILNRVLAEKFGKLTKS